VAPPKAHATPATMPYGSAHSRPRIGGGFVESSKRRERALRGASLFELDTWPRFMGEGGARLCARAGL